MAQTGKLCGQMPSNKMIKTLTSSKYTHDYSREVKSDITDNILIEIGDSKQVDFKPQFKVMRWDNEVNFSMRAFEHPEAIVEKDGNKIKYITPDYEIHQYEKPEAGEDGGFEFEWIINKKPASNVFSATIQTKELEFIYQGELTEEEKLTSLRPDNVIGSYAVYHSSKKNIVEGGKNYKTGKVFHVYRPHVKDAEGNEAWGILNINTETGVLTVTVSEKFLSSAVYPVVVDPTFGYTSQGASDKLVFDNSGDYRVGFRADAITGTLTAVAAYLKGAAVNNRYVFHLYSHSGSTPNASLANSGNQTLNGTTYTLKSNTVSYSMVVDTYWAVVEGFQLVSGTGSIAYDTGNTTDYGAFRALSWLVDSNRYSIYATYTSSASFNSHAIMTHMSIAGGLI